VCRELKKGWETLVYPEIHIAAKIWDDTWPSGWETLFWMATSFGCLHFCGFSPNSKNEIEMWKDSGHAHCSFWGIHISLQKIHLKDWNHICNTYRMHTAVWHCVNRNETHDEPDLLLEWPFVCYLTKHTYKEADICNAWFHIFDYWNIEMI